jgi:4-diphosphocytidyl-2-C-methyl-D-erythritol kinase
MLEYKMNSIELHANAKINLALAVKHKRDDGYHELELIFQEINLSDRLELSTADKVMFSTDSNDLKDASENICLRAARLMQQEFGISGLKIYLEKRIPIGGGLGGGSSDAAAVLNGIKDLYNLKISDEHMLDLALKLGADVPFFLHGKTAYGTGIGEILKPISINSTYHILLVIPEIRISTVWAYKNLNLTLTSKNGDYKFRGFRFQNLKLSEFRNEFYNDFEKSVFKAYPLLAELKSCLYEKGASFAAMSGSGSVLFGLYEKEKSCFLAFESIRRTQQCIVTKPVI